MATPFVPDTATTAAPTDERALLDQIRELEDTKARIAATQAELTVQLDHLVRARHAQDRIPAARQGRDVAGLIAFARRESPAKGSRLLGLAHALTEQPHLHAAMRAGVISEWRATLIARETSCLSRQDRALVDAEICQPAPDGTYPFHGWGDRRLTAETQKAVIRIDAQAVVNRRSKAEADRHVSMRPAPDTMARLSALLTAKQGVAVWATLTRIADQARSAGDPRTRGQVMADTLVERITGLADATAIPVVVNVVISDQALLGDSVEPAWLHGYGPLPADAVDPEHLTAIRRLYAKPATGSLVAMESVAREFPTALARFIELRDRTCRTPWCDAPIRHRDHAEDHATGGPTTSINGQGLCEHCNHTKQAPGWRSRPLNGPPDQRHTIETRLPTGHTMRSTAPPTPTPSTTRQISPAETYLLEVVLAA
ncbi:HNH endonuclease [Nocardioides conyzicola]|uniref:HNH endonuclease signature motif containing protein n=1 Tax=Nocardioides conyzicola TaxID=1651781 RepID=A0ABP8XHD8_9ACTN